MKPCVSGLAGPASTDTRRPPSTVTSSEQVSGQSSGHAVSSRAVASMQGSSSQGVIRPGTRLRTDLVSSLALVAEVIPRAVTGDVRLVQRIAAGDETALTRIYDQFAPTVFGVARRVLGDPAAAEDVVQEVFVSLWERPAAFDSGRGTLAAWLGMLAHRRAVDRVRREEASRRRADAMASQPPVAPPDLDEAVSTLWIGERVRSAVQELPEEQRACVQPRVLRGEDVHRGRGDPRHPRGHGEVADAPRAPQAGGHPERGRHLVMAVNEELEQKLAALALDALEADERDDVESRLGSDPAAAAEAARLQEAAAWLGSLAAATPASDLRNRVLDAAQERRAAGAGVDPDPAASIDPVEIFRRGVAASIAEIERLASRGLDRSALEAGVGRSRDGRAPARRRALPRRRPRTRRGDPGPPARRARGVHPAVDRCGAHVDPERVDPRVRRRLHGAGRARRHARRRNAHGPDAVLRVRRAAIDRTRRRELRALGPRRRHPPCCRARPARAVRRRALAHVPAGRRHPAVHDGLRRHAAPRLARRGLSSPALAAAPTSSRPAPTRHRRARRTRSSWSTHSASAGSRVVTSTWTTSTSRSRATRRWPATCSPARGCSRADPNLVTLS